MSYLLDTNILIYLLKGDVKVKKMLDSFRQSQFAISIISRFEVLMGSDKETYGLNEIEEYLDLFENINLDKKIVKAANVLAKNMSKKLKFKDLIIAATAQVCKKTLITSDRDFEDIPGIRVKYFR